MNPIPWYKSPTTVSLVVGLLTLLLSLFPRLAPMLGTPDLINAVAQSILQFAGTVATGVGLYFRAKSTVQPVTLTKASAVAQTTEATQAVQTLHDTGSFPIRSKQE